MKNKTTYKKIGLLLILVILLTTSVLAIGIRPAKTELNGDETKFLQGTFWVVNNNQVNFDVDVYVEGEMREYVTLETEKLSFREDEEARPVNYKLALPDKVPPGKSVAVIVVEESLGESSSNVVSSKVRLKHKINIQGEYPDKYIEVKLNFHNLDDRIEIVSENDNLGKQDINSLQTKFYVNNKKQEIETKETEITDIKTKQTKLLKTNLAKDNFDEGEYEISAVVFFDDLTTEIAKILRVGEPTVDIVYYDKFFSANKVNQYNVDVENRWNKPVENVFIDVNIKQDGQEIDQFRTKSVEIGAEMTKKIKDYFDATDKDVGKYTFELIANYWNTYKMASNVISYEGELFSEKKFEELEKEGSNNNLAGAATGDTSSFGFKQYIFIIPLFILILIIGIFVGYRYAHKNEYEGGDEGAF